MKDQEAERESDNQEMFSHLIVLASLLLLSLPILFLMCPRAELLKPIAGVADADEAEDLALFRRASLSPSTVAAAIGSSPPKIAFMFLTNSDLSFAPLWERFFAGHARRLNVYVHADPTTPLSLPPTPSFRGRLILSKPTRRASPTLISAARRLLAAALLDDPANAFFALLSQHCIPLHSFGYLYHSLLASSDSPRAHKFPLGSLPLRRRHLSFIEVLPGHWDRYVARGEDVMLPEVAFSQFRVGSQFFVLARRHALVVVRDKLLWKKFRLPCLESYLDSCYPEEHYFPTLLDMHDHNGCTGYTLTRVNWTDSVGGHPHTYGPPEISAELIKELRRSNSTYSHLFARKFSPDCLDPLLTIADTVIFRD